MVDLRLLSKSEFLDCFAQPMSRVTAAKGAPIDIWPHVDAILEKDPQHQVRDVTHVYRDALHRYDQILIQTDARNVFLVIVVDLTATDIFGYHWLDLNKEYGREG
ncbi:hypothetical protein [Labrys sp. ZIDIC5]|uniref:hypothetical protein n=1 Tax=Labrys sedimenti TaxID=3106036 RepID=UPI002ACA1CC5|nr:hypothetical protein [Labrys sp. ZIDIC5]MDZ5453875.1 hypothetical protein [Labrys sp. ZIDIC5]